MLPRDVCQERDGHAEIEKRRRRRREGSMHSWRGPREEGDSIVGDFTQGKGTVHMIPSPSLIYISHHCLMVHIYTSMEAGA